MKIAIIASIMTMIGASDAPAADSVVAIKIAPENSYINPLPLSASEAERRFGILTDAQIKVVSATSRRLVGETCDQSSAAWTGPKLFMSHSATLDYQPTDLPSVCKAVRGGTVTTYDPYSLGSRGNETYAVVMTKADPGAGATANWTAIAFVLNGDVLRRIVVAPQPWVHLLPGRR